MSDELRRLSGFFETQFLQLYFTTSKVGMPSSYHNTLMPALLETMGTRETSLV